MVGILDDKDKFVEFHMNDNEVLKELIKIEKNIKSILDPLYEKGVFTKEIHKRLLPTGSQPGKMYGLCKVHKPSVNGCPPCRPILSAIGTPTYNLAKYLITILEPLTKNSFVVKDSFTFVEDIKKQDSKYFMSTFDVDSLFTNIPLDETIDLCTNKLFPKKNMKVKGLRKNEFKSLLQIATKESLFIFNGLYYRQIDGVAMGSPLGPTMANIFLCHNEDIWLTNCPEQFKPKYYQRYVDDIFVLFCNKDHVNKFDKYINSRHQNMNFSKEVEIDSCISFLDIKIKRCMEFVTSIYRKPTFSGIYMNFKSHAPIEYKKGLINCLLYRIFNLCTNWDIIHREINNLKAILLRNKYPLNFIDYHVRIFLRNIFVASRKKEEVASKEEIRIILPFLGNQSNIVKRQLNRLFCEFYPNAKLKIIWTCGIKIGNYFKFKDIIPSHIRSLVIYQYTCSGCNTTYIGKTKRHFKVRMCEHLGISHLTGKKLKYNYSNATAVREHIEKSGHIGNFDDFNILNSARNDFECLIKESLLIKKFDPELNKQIKSFQLELF